MPHHPLPLAVALLTAVLAVPAAAGWKDWLQDAISPEPAGEQAPAGLSALSGSEMTQGLKQALGQGVEQAVTYLGRQDGFLGTPRVRIPVPEQVQGVASTLRKLGQGEAVERFETTLNRAAEAAVPETATVLKDAISAMSVQDAKDILTGPDDAATQYFRRSSEDRLRERIRPIVEQTTDQVGVTSAYKKLMGEVGSVTAMLGRQAPDLDGYVTGKALDGLFLMIAEEERRIRENPVARTTDLLKKVFGAAGGS